MLNDQPVSQTLVCDPGKTPPGGRWSDRVLRRPSPAHHVPAPPRRDSRITPSRSRPSARCSCPSSGRAGTSSGSCGNRCDSHIGRHVESLRVEIGQPIRNRRQNRLHITSPDTVWPVVRHEVSPGGFGDVFPLRIVPGVAGEEPSVGFLSGSPVRGTSVVTVQRGMSAFVKEDLLQEAFRDSRLRLVRVDVDNPKALVCASLRWICRGDLNLDLSDVRQQHQRQPPKHRRIHVYLFLRRLPASVLRVELKLRDTLSCAVLHVEQVSITRNPTVGKKVPELPFAEAHVFHAAKP